MQGLSIAYLGAPREGLGKGRPPPRAGLPNPRPPNCGLADGPVKDPEK